MPFRADAEGHFCFVILCLQHTDDAGDAKTGMHKVHPCFLSVC